MEAELLELEREDRLETLLDDLDELEKLLLRLCLDRTEERELLLVRLRFSLSLDVLDADRERLLDFLDNERLRDLFCDSDLLLEFLEREERLRDLLFDNDRFLLLDREADFLPLEGDLDALVRLDSVEEDLERGERFVLAFGDDFFVLETDLEVDRASRRSGEADFLPRERDRDFLSPNGDLEDLALFTDGDLVHDLDADLEYDLLFFGDLER